MAATPLHLGRMRVFSNCVMSCSSYRQSCYFILIDWMDQKGRERSFSNSIPFLLFYQLPTFFSFPSNFVCCSLLSTLTSSSYQLPSAGSWPSWPYSQLPSLPHQEEAEKHVASCFLLHTQLLLLLLVLFMKWFIFCRINTWTTKIAFNIVC
jgi:hypothetical protein